MHKVNACVVIDTLILMFINILNQVYCKLFMSYIP
jgi:hypothetical protein